MGKTKTEKQSEIIEAAVLQGMEDPRKPTEEFDFDNFEFKTLKDFEIYNAQVRKHNRKCLHDRNKMKVKIPDESYYKKVEIKFQRFDQPENILKVRVRNKDIDWKGQLKPGCKYSLPIPVIKFLNALAVPIYEEVKVDGSSTRTETVRTGERPRFSCQVLEFA